MHPKQKRPDPKINSKNHKQKMTRREITFPAAWLWLVDELIPTWVKQNYSPRESWRDKPFNLDDGHFFFRGIDELSELFTDERPTQLPSYFTHPKFRSAYLLYFLPLQAAKFLSTFQMHPEAFEAALKEGKRSGTLHIADLGAGPGTASIAALLQLLETTDCPPIELHWIDTNKSIMEDGRGLVEQLAAQFPKLRGKVKVHLHVAPWWEAPHYLPPQTALILLGNVLNEAQLPRSLTHASPSSDDLDHESPVKLTKALHLWSDLIQRMRGGGILFLEPALRRASQLLTHWRDELIEAELIKKEPGFPIWGPCLHAGSCPLSQGRDWCHFSVPLQIPGKWFAQFSKGLGSERQWVKFSYLWLASAEARPKPPASQLRRVISDPLHSTSQGQRSSDVVLICEPERADKLRVPGTLHARRGDLIQRP